MKLLRHTFSAHINNVTVFKKQVVFWLQNNRVFACYDNNFYQHYTYSNYELLVGAGVHNFFTATENSFHGVNGFLKNMNDWCFGHFAYDLKNETEKLTSSNSDSILFPELYFFQPETVIYIKKDSHTVTIECISENPKIIFESIVNIELQSNETSSKQNNILSIKSKFSKEEYITIVEQIRQHIAKGDFYEMNLCMEFFAENSTINPYEVFFKLNEINAAPFSALYRLNHNYLICSSPERFLMKQNNKIISQPIKGTIKRAEDIALDNERKNILQNDTKERAENVMIVDLVRNDLAKSCEAGSVKVEELFKVYTFSQVHHLISTISGALKNNVQVVDAIKNAFPMGSMTGAPKVIVMQHIEQYEKTKRGLYSGSVGYFSPNGNFDFNVVIRSILYNATNQYVSFQVGSAITYDAVAEKEYEECLLKANAMIEALK